VRGWGRPEVCPALRRQQLRFSVAPIPKGRLNQSHVIYENAHPYHRSSLGSIGGAGRPGRGQGHL
jgi:hypothetical protein